MDTIIHLFVQRYEISPKPRLRQNGKYIKIALSLGYGCARLFFKGRRFPCSGSLKTSRLKAFILHFVSVPAKWVRTGRQNVLNLYTNKAYYSEVFLE